MPDIAAERKVGELSFAFNRDEPGGLKFLDVVRKSRGRDGHVLAQIATGHHSPASADLLEYLEAARIGQGARNQRNLPCGKPRVFAGSHGPNVTGRLSLFVD